MFTSSVPALIGLLELVLFFACDLLFARALNAHKREYPELDECAPADSPDLDTVAVLDSLASTAVDFYQHNRGRLGGGDDNSARAYTSVDGSAPAGLAEEMGSAARANPLHAVVVVCGTIAPIATLLLLFFNGAFGWTAFAVPLWLSYIVIVPGLAAVGLFAARVVDVRGYVDMTKSQWISLMWFRVDFMFIMGAVAFFGAGAWLVAGCMVGVAAYLAHRVMRMEKHLSRAQRATQLVRDEVDVTRVLRPGSEEAKKAMGIQEGYSALSH